ncbi:MAG: response regulator transcription factor [Candidatus Melainabacteria bacterium]|jgi:two-component system, OmpR family, response regulator MprA|nr:response regulator transcription factor [Candidatus Melainabacteria bacterium]
MNTTNIVNKPDNKDTKVLIIEDEAQITRLIELELKYEGYEVITAVDGLEGLKSIRDGGPDLVLLDCMLPNMSGEEVCKQVRSDSDNVPIIMITAKDSIEDKVKGLDYGADDYLVKPFATEELLARIRAVLRRKPKEQAGTLNYDDLWLDQFNRLAKRGDDVLELRSKEFSLLRVFMMNPEKYLTREFLFNKVWGYDFIGESNVIEVYIRYLRSKLQEKKQGKLIHTKRGEGYMLRKSDLK